jgi:hypothetical protein
VIFYSHFWAEKEATPGWAKFIWNTCCLFDWFFTLIDAVEDGKQPRFWQQWQVIQSVTRTKNIKTLFQVAPASTQTCSPGMYFFFLPDYFQVIWGGWKIHHIIFDFSRTFYCSILNRSLDGSVATKKQKPNTTYLVSCREIAIVVIYTTGRNTCAYMKKRLKKCRWSLRLDLRELVGHRDGFQHLKNAVKCSTYYNISIIRLLDSWFSPPLPWQLWPW